MHFHNWESPASDKKIIRAESITLIGWFFTDDYQVAKAFHVRLGDRVVTSRRNVVRKDVSDAFDGQAPENAGFDIRFNTGGGFKYLSLEAELKDGSRVLLGRQLYYIKKARAAKSPWAKLVEKRRHLKRIHDLRSKYQRQLKDTEAKDDSSNASTLDVIIPCYRGVEETRQCLESIYTSRDKNQSPFEIIAIDDSCPEPELSEYLKNESEAGRITLLVNENNLGFVGTVNRGMCLHPKRHCLLLNSDTEVFGNWVDRIVRCAASNKQIGTITPFSNNATLCSYPANGQDNQLPDNLPPKDLDRLFSEQNAGKYCEIPTGVGFCMFIRRDTLSSVGYFDFETFGRGYGEENDFCRRILLKGWLNVQLLDTFVYHKGAVSFCDTSHPRIIEAITSINRLYPGYDALIQKFFQEDPARSARAKVDAVRIESSAHPRILFVSHDRGGGTYRHMVELAEHLAQRATFFLVTPLKDKPSQYQLRHLPSGQSISVTCEKLDFSGLVKTLKQFGIERIHFHHVIDVDKQLLTLARELEIPYDVTVHDYFYFCPQITVSYPKDGFCGLPEIATCERCLNKYPVNGIASISTFRQTHEAFLNAAHRVIVPSQWTLDATKLHFPDAPFIQANHIEKPVQASAQRVSKPPETLTVGILGALSPEKGADLLEAVAKDAHNRNLPIRFVLFGYAYKQLSASNTDILTITGKYDAHELGELLAEFPVHLFWFPAIWPESYSYTLSECMKRGYPIVAPNIGAFPERLDNYPSSWILPWNHPAKFFNDKFLEIFQNKELTQKQISTPIEEFYETHYL